MFRIFSETARGRERRSFDQEEPKRPRGRLRLAFQCSFRIVERALTTRFQSVTCCSFRVVHLRAADERKSHRGDLRPNNDTNSVRSTADRASCGWHDAPIPAESVARPWPSGGHRRPPNRRQRRICSPKARNWRISSTRISSTFFLVQRSNLMASSAASRNKRTNGRRPAGLFLHLVTQAHSVGNTSSTQGK
jgi:hypothetical protein